MCPGATIAARWPALGEDLGAETLHRDTTSMAEIGGKVGDSAGTQHPWLCSPATVLQRNITSRHSPASMVAMAVLQRSIQWHCSTATMLQRSIHGAARRCFLSAVVPSLVLSYDVVTHGWKR